MTYNKNDYSEVNRKIMHLLILLYPVLYNIWPRKVTIIIAGTLIVLDIIVESIRLTFPSINRMLLKPFKGMYRQNEQNNISTLIWTFTGAFLTIFLFEDPKIVTVSLLYMALGDFIAALVGTHHGRTKITSKKSLEGSLACFVVCLILGIFFLPWKLAFIGAGVATIVELLPLPLNDNFWLPVSSGFALTFLMKFFVM